MVTVLRESGYRFVIHTDDHAPAHVHVWARGKVAKLLLEPVSVVKTGGFNRSEISNIVDLTLQYQAVLLAEWDKRFETR